MARSVLLIDDSHTVLAFLTDRFRKAGYRVAALQRFVDLPTLLRDFRPDLIVLDLELPTLPGTTIGNYIRKYQSAPIPMFIYSSAAEPAARAAAEQLGAVACFTKSPDVGPLLKAAERVLAGR